MDSGHNMPSRRVYIKKHRSSVGPRCATPSLLFFPGMTFHSVSFILPAAKAMQTVFYMRLSWQQLARDL